MELKDCPNGRIRFTRDPEYHKTFPRVKRGRAERGESLSWEEGEGAQWLLVMRRKADLAN